LMRSLQREPPLSPARFEEAKKAQIERYRSTYTGFRDVPEVVMAWEEMGITGGDPRPERFRRTMAYRMEDFAGFAGNIHGKADTVFILGNRDRVDMAKLMALGDFEEKKLSDIFPY